MILNAKEAPEEGWGANLQIGKRKKQKSTSHAPSPNSVQSGGHCCSKGCVPCTMRQVSLTQSPAHGSPLDNQSTQFPFPFHLSYRGSAKGKSPSSRVQCDPWRLRMPTACANQRREHRLTTKLWQQSTLPQRARTQLTNMAPLGTHQSGTPVPCGCFYDPWSTSNPKQQQNMFPTTSMSCVPCVLYSLSWLINSGKN